MATENAAQVSEYRDLWHPHFKLNQYLGITTASMQKTLSSPADEPNTFIEYDPLGNADHELTRMPR